MAESITHINFVKKVYEESLKVIPSGNFKLIEVDLPESKKKPSKNINNFIPDLYYNFDGLLVIGEAKTSKDIDREHSLLQYESYFNEIINFKGKSVLIFASPWYVKNTLKNIIRRLCRKTGKKVDARFVIEIGESESL